MNEQTAASSVPADESDQSFPKTVKAEQSDNQGIEDELEIDEDCVFEELSFDEDEDEAEEEDPLVGILEELRRNEIRELDLSSCELPDWFVSDLAKIFSSTTGSLLTDLCLDGNLLSDDSLAAIAQMSTIPLPSQPSSSFASSSSSSSSCSSTSSTRPLLTLSLAGVRPARSRTPSTTGSSSPSPSPPPQEDSPPVASVVSASGFAQLAGSLSGGVPLESLLGRARHENETTREGPVLPVLDRRTSAVVPSAGCLLGTLCLADNELAGWELELLAEALRWNVSLTSLDLDRTGMGPRGAAVLGRALQDNRRLLRLSVASNGVGMVGAMAFARLLQRSTALQRLDLSRNAIGETGVVALAEGLAVNTTLHELRLDGNEAVGGGGGGASRAEGCRSVGSDSDNGDSNSPSNNNCTSTTTTTSKLSAMNVLCAAVAGHVSLQALHLRNCCITAEAGEALARMLATNDSLTHVDLACSSLRHGANALGPALRANRRLRSLDLSENGIEQVDELARGLRHNSCLASLYLGYNALGPDAGAALGKLLVKNRSLCYLGLAYNGLGSAVVPMAEGLRTNPRLLELNLACNAVEVEGSVALANALQQNASLTSLFLAWNPIAPEALLALGSALMVNTSLMSLDLGGVHVEEASVRDLLSLVLHNQSLLTLEIEHNDDDQTAAQLDSILERNLSNTERRHCSLRELAFEKICTLEAEALELIE